MLRRLEIIGMLITHSEPETRNLNIIIMNYYTRGSLTHYNHTSIATYNIY